MPPTIEDPSADLELPSEPGKITYARFAPQPPDDHELPELHGDWEKHGGAYLFYFPFDLFIDPELDAHQLSVVDDTRIRIYPPFQNEADRAGAVSQIRLESIPNPKGAVPADYDRVRMKDIRKTRRLGTASNALRIDFLPDREPDYAKEILDQFLGLARWWTRQWWIGKDRRYSDQYLRNWFPINAEHERVNGIQSFVTAYGFLGFEQPLGIEEFRAIRGNITNGRTIPLHWDLFCEAIYYHAAGDRDKTILELAIACEAGVASIYELVTANRDGLNQADLDDVLNANFEHRIGDHGRDIVGESFQKEYPDAYDLVYDLWVARGHVAHGKPPRVRSGQVWDTDDLIEVIYAVGDLLGWLNGHRPDV